MERNIETKVITSRTEIDSNLNTAYWVTWHNLVHEGQKAKAKVNMS